MSNPLNRFGNWSSERMVALALACWRRGGTTLVVTLLVAALGFAAATRLRIDADLTELLPESFRSVQDLHTLSDRFGGIGYVVVVGQNAEPAALKRFADDLAPKLEKEVPSAAWVDYRRPLEFFKDRMLFFLEPEDLEVVRDQLRERIEWEKKQRNPLYLDLEDSEPPSIEFDELREKYAGSSDKGWMKGQSGDAYYIDPERRMILLLVKPQHLSSDLARSKELVDEVRQVVSRVDLSQYGPDMTVAYSGRFMRKVEQEELIQSDLRFATILSLLLVLGYLALHFRRAYAVVLVVAPLVVGLLWTYGIVSLTFGSLNVLTAFVGAILLGLGIDHGIHLLGRLEAEYAEGKSHEEIVRRTFGETGRAVVVAALTTVVGFSALALSEFKPFREFGIIAGGGMLLVVVAYTTVLPALLGVALRRGWKPHLVEDKGAETILAWVGRRAPRLLAGFAVLATVGFVGMGQAQFSYDFRALAGGDLPSFELEKEVNDILGYSETPVVALTESLEEERLIAKTLRDRTERAGAESTVLFVAAGADLVPTHQEDKVPVLREIGDIIAEIKLSWLDKDQRPLFKRFITMTKAEPYGKANLPPEVQRQFQGINATRDEGFVLIFPNISLHDGAQVQRFAEEVRSIPLPNGRVVSAAGEEMILADVIHMVSNEAPPVLGLTLLFVFLMLLVLLQNVKDALICFATAFATLVITLAVLPLAQIPLNYLNIVMIPVLFGIAVDGAVHLVNRARTSSNPTHDLGETLRAIAGAILTTGLGFGALLIANHPGLNSLGIVAVLGLAVNMLVCAIVVPAFLLWRRGSAVASVETRKAA